MPPEVDTLAERYVLETPIARGGMATVWRAKDEVLARAVAVKILNPDLAEDEGFLQRFRAEALAAARLTHPNIIQTFDTGEDQEGRHFIVMEFCPGGTIQEFLAKHGALGADRAIPIASSVCDALGYAHRHDVIHRDIKPANVLIGSDGSLKVADFGIAKAAFTGGDLTTTSKILGTVTYLSPEQARGEEPEARSDLYSLGVMLYELLVGRPPFRGETQIATAMMHLREEPPALRTMRAGIPRHLEAVVLKALEKDPEERFASADEMRAALEAGRGVTQRNIPVAATADTTSVPTAEPHDEERWIGKVLLLIGVIVAAAIAIAYLAGEPEGRAPSNGRDGGSNARIVEATVSDFDPHGGGEEHSEEAPAAIDGNTSTTWTTESYDDSLQLLGKSGVGLVFDLRTAVLVERVEIAFGTPGVDFELRAGESLGSDETAFSLIEERSEAPGSVTLEPGREARYWLVWITDLPGGGGGEASIAEVRFFK